MPENTLQRQPAGPVWIWFVLLLGLVLLYYVYHHATSKKAPWIQEDIQTRVTQKLHLEQGLQKIIAVADGRDITLTGNVDDQDTHSKAQQIASATYGVRLVSNQLAINSTPSAADKEKIDNDSMDSPAATTAIKEQPIAKAKVEPLPEMFAPLDEDIDEKLHDNVVELESQQQESTATKVAQAEIAQQQLSQLDFSSITFEKNSAALTANARATLDEATRTLLENPAVQVLVEGHTDTSGNPDLNLKLSKQRANSVLEYFIASGIENSRVEADGFGDQFPIAPNDTQAGRIKNRRIEIKVKNGD